MTPKLLDTNILSELQKKSPDAGVLSILGNWPIESLFISVITLAEIRYGIQVAPAERRAPLEVWLAGTVRPMFEGRVLPITEEVMVRWRMLVAQGRKTGRVFSQPDLFLAATAHEYRMTLVTRNVRDFAGLEIPILNPWL